jgi:hypothetical protein
MDFSQFGAGPQNSGPGIWGDVWESILQQINIDMVGKTYQVWIMFLGNPMGFPYLW